MTLTIKPVKLKQSIYFRVPSDIADLIGIDADAGVTLSLEEREDCFLLTYSVPKSSTDASSSPRSQGLGQEASVPVPKLRGSTSASSSQRF